MVATQANKAGGQSPKSRTLSKKQNAAKFPPSPGDPPGWAEENARRHKEQRKRQQKKANKSKKHYFNDLLTGKAAYNVGRELITPEIAQQIWHGERRARRMEQRKLARVSQRHARKAHEGRGGDSVVAFAGQSAAKAMVIKKVEDHSRAQYEKSLVHNPEFMADWVHDEKSPPPLAETPGHLAAAMLRQHENEHPNYVSAHGESTAKRATLGKNHHTGRLSESITSVGVATGAMLRQSFPHLTYGESGVRIRHSEYIGVMTTGELNGADTVFTAESYALNPGLPYLPWLSRIAAGFRTWTMSGTWRVHYVSRVGSGEEGSVMMAQQLDTTAPLPISEGVMMTLAGASEFQPWLARATMDLHRGHAPDGLKYIRHERKAGAPQLYDEGQFFLATQGEKTAAKTMGKMFLEYDVELTLPNGDPDQRDWGTTVTNILGPVNDTVVNGAGNHTKLSFSGIEQYMGVDVNPLQATLGPAGVVTNAQIGLPTGRYRFRCTVTMSPGLALTLITLTMHDVTGSGVMWNGVCCYGHTNSHGYVTAILELDAYILDTMLLEFRLHNSVGPANLNHIVGSTTVIPTAPGGFFAITGLAITLIS